MVLAYVHTGVIPKMDIRSHAGGAKRAIFQNLSGVSLTVGAGLAIVHLWHSIFLEKWNQGCLMVALTANSTRGWNSKDVTARLTIFVSKAVVVEILDKPTS